MRFKRTVIIILTLIIFYQANTCTTFFLHHNGKMIFGRNYDWSSDAGMVYSNQRGLAKTSAKTPDGGGISWISQYGSITFNQYGKEFPTGGMNEKGLVVELMWLEGTQYPAPDERPSVNVLQWIQYQLDNHATVDEVIESDSQLRITSRGTPLHYLIADGTGQSASIEFLDGKMTVHKGDQLPFPVLANDRYDQSLRGYTGGTNGINSLDRFNTACTMIRDYTFQAGTTLSPVDVSFNILDKVAQGNYTKWSIVYDITDKTILFKTQRFRQLRSINMSAFDFSCSTPPKQINMNGKEQGEIANLFTGYSAESNESLLDRAIAESGPRVSISRDDRRRILAYPGTISCK